MNKKLRKQRHDKNQRRTYGSKLEREYGITLAAVETKLKEQDNKCGICEIELTPENHGVDHCHITYKFRGILCKKCNCGLGLLGDTIEALQKAVNYLRENSLKGK